MHCMKCGQDTGGSQVFCPGCLSEMEKYPIKPGTPVYIPSRPRTVHKSQRHPAPVEPETQVRQLTRKIRWLTAALIIALTALAASAGLIYYLHEQPDNPFSTGQDYNVSGSTNSPDNPSNLVP